MLTVLFATLTYKPSKVEPEIVKASFLRLIISLLSPPPELLEAEMAKDEAIPVNPVPLSVNEPVNEPVNLVDA